MSVEVFLPLSRGLVAVIDFDDFERVGRVKWYAQTTNCGAVYAARNRPSGSKPRLMLLHREVMHCPQNRQVDHVNGDTLDNRKSNLRKATDSQNKTGFRRSKTGTSSKFRGVCWYKRDALWQARLSKERTIIFLGRFLNEEDAARAYDAAAIKHFGEFACLNFPIDNKNQNSN
jgi:hypothetical protein